MMAAYRDRRTWFCTCICPGILMLVGLLALTFGEHFTYPVTQLSVFNDFNRPLPMPFIALTPNARALFDRRFQPEFVHVDDQTALSNASIGSVASMYALSNYLIDSWQLAGPTLGGQSRYFAYVSGLLVNSPPDGTNTPLVSDTSVLFFNTTATYGLPISANYYNSLCLQWLTGSNASSISLSDSPLPVAQSLQQLQSGIVAIFLGLAVSFVPLAFVAYVVKEDSAKVKHQQLISGVSNVAYWTSNYVWDFINFLLPAGLMMILLAAFDVGDMIGSNSGATIVALLMYAVSVIPLTYFLSFFFENSNVSSIAVMMINIILGPVLATVSNVLDILGGSTADVNRHLKYLYRVSPTFCISEIALNQFNRNALALFVEVKPLWDMEVVGYPLIFMAWESVFWFGVVLLVEYIRYTPDLIARVRPIADAPEEEFHDDEDVVKERERVLTMPLPSKERPGDMITIKGLRKVYPPANGQPALTAVHSLYLGIPEGQCFGYLGINGAGKTTTLKMLTGEILPSRGQAFLNGLDISKNQMDVRRLIGYCPQFDALIETLTAREHLTLFARIKGIPSQLIPTYVEGVLSHLGLQEGLADKPVAGYSGGNKRKLCVGISLIGNPPLVFLDEPSTGMDPASRRALWDLIAATMKGRSVILTTHSMDECEALCSRLGIMVGGRFRCLGTLQHLRSRYGNDYQVDVHVHATSASTGSNESSTEGKGKENSNWNGSVGNAKANDSANAAVSAEEHLSQLQVWLTESFPGLKVLELQSDSCKVRVPKRLSDGTDMSIANMFRIFEENRKRFGISDYSVSESTLEQIFIHFAKQQEMIDEKVYQRIGMTAEAQPDTAKRQKSELSINVGKHMRENAHEHEDGCGIELEQKHEHERSTRDTHMRSQNHSPGEAAVDLIIHYAPTPVGASTDASSASAEEATPQLEQRSGSDSNDDPFDFDVVLHLPEHSKSTEQPSR